MDDVSDEAWGAYPGGPRPADLAVRVPDGGYPGGPPAARPSGPVMPAASPPARARSPRPWGMGDVALGLAAYLVLSAVPAVLVIPYALLSADPGADAAELTADVERLATTGPVLLASLLLGWAGLLASVVWAGTRKGTRDWRDLVSWRGWAWSDVVLALGLTVAIRAVELVLLQAVAATGVPPEELSNSQVVTDQSGVWLVLLAVCAAVGAPIVEETFFRGMFLTVARRNWGTVAGVVVTSLVFGLLHAQTTLVGSLVIVAETALIGAVLAVVVLRSGRLSAAILLHVCVNTSGIALALLAGSA